MPLVGGQLAGDQRGLALAAIIEDLAQVAVDPVGPGRKTEDSISSCTLRDARATRGQFGDEAGTTGHEQGPIFGRASFVID
jgi:hypothetical protein